MLKRLATLLLGIGLIGLGVLLFVAPSGPAVMQWLTKLWPIFLILAGLVRVFGYLIDRHPRSPVGGMMITAVGGILLAAKLRGDHSVLLLFGQYWFFLLLALIIGRVLRQYTHRVEDGRRTHAFSPGAIVLMALLVGGGLASNYLAKNRQFLNGVEFKLGNLGLFTSQFEVKGDSVQPLTLSPDSRLVIHNFRGNIEISAGGAAEPTVNLIKRIRANNQDEASQIAKNVQLQIKHIGKEAQFEVLAEGIQNDFSGTLAITVPTTVSGGVEIANATGSIKLNGLRGNHLIRACNGIEVKNNTGDIKVERPLGSVELLTIQGNVAVADSVRDVNLGEVRGSITVGANGGRISIGGSIGPVKLRARDARIEVQEISSSAQLAANQTLVALEEVANSRVSISEIHGNVAVSAERSLIEAEGIVGNLTVRNFSERVQVNRINGALKINAENSTVEVTEVKGSADIETTRDVSVRDFRGALTVRTSSGAINLSTDEKLAGNIKVNSERGRIRISIPEDSGFKLDAGTDGGRIKVRGFGGLEVPKRQRQFLADYNFSPSSPVVVLRSSRGDIELQSSGLALASRDDE